MKILFVLIFFYRGGFCEESRVLIFMTLTWKQFKFFLFLYIFNICFWYALIYLLKWFWLNQSILKLGNKTKLIKRQKEINLLKKFLSNALIFISTHTYLYLSNNGNKVVLHLTHFQCYANASTHCYNYIYKVFKIRIEKMKNIYVGHTELNRFLETNVFSMLKRIRILLYFHKESDRWLCVILNSGIIRIYYYVYIMRVL